jgi:superfamily II DNA/RNA helicase
MDPDARERALLGLLTKYHSSRTNRVLVFVLYKKEADRVQVRTFERCVRTLLAYMGTPLAPHAPHSFRTVRRRVQRTLSARGWACGAIHGDMTQEARSRSLEAFKNGKVRRCLLWCPLCSICVCVGVGVGASVKGSAKVTPPPPHTTSTYPAVAPSHCD